VEHDGTVKRKLHKIAIRLERPLVFTVLHGCGVAPAQIHDRLNLRCDFHCNCAVEKMMFHWMVVIADVWKSMSFITT